MKCISSQKSYLTRPINFSAFFALSIWSSHTSSKCRLLDSSFYVQSIIQQSNWMSTKKFDIFKCHHLTLALFKPWIVGLAILLLWEREKEKEKEREIERARARVRVGQREREGERERNWFVAQEEVWYIRVFGSTFVCYLCLRRYSHSR
jgi:hypothetical protein